MKIMEKSQQRFDKCHHDFGREKTYWQKRLKKRIIVIE